MNINFAITTLVNQSQILQCISVSQCSVYHKMITHTHMICPIQKIENLPHTRSQVRVPPMLVYLCAAMLATKRSAGIIPEVNLRNPLHAGNEACRQGIHRGVETQGRHHQKSKTGVSVVVQKQLQILVKKIENVSLYVCHSTARRKGMDSDDIRGGSRTSRLSTH